MVSPPRFSDINRLTSSRPADDMLPGIISAVLDAPISGKTKKQQTSDGGGWIFWSGRGQWGRLGAPQQHCQPSANALSPDSVDPKILAYFNVTSTSLTLSTVRTLDLRTS